MAKTPKISVLIRTFNSGKTLGEVLSALDFSERDECIIVDSGSTDDTIDIAARYNAKILKIDPPFNYSRSLNAGFSLAKGDWVMVLSSHCIPLRSDLLARMREVAATSLDTCAVIYGTVQLYDRRFHSTDVIRVTHDSWQANPKLRGGNGFAVYPRSAWVKQPFDETLRTAEDLAWLQQALTAGFEARIVNDAAVLYRNKGSLPYMFKKGWHETLNSMIMANGFSGAKPWSHALRTFMLNTAYLTKVLILGRCDPGAYLRMTAHGLGAALAGSSNKVIRIKEKKNTNL